MGAKIAAGEHLLVQGTRIRNDAGNVFANVSAVDPRRGDIAVTRDVGAVKEEVVIETTGGQARDADLVPPADIDGSVR